MIRATFKLVSCVALSSLMYSGPTHTRFPSWGRTAYSLPGLWCASSIVAVGHVKNVAEYGVQTVENLPSFVKQRLDKLYWCQGDFLVQSVIKGELSRPGKKFLWATVNPGCRLQFGDEKAYEWRSTRVWFLREEGEFLRPAVDSGRYLVGFSAPWRDGTDMPPLERFGVLLLSPLANERSLSDYADTFWSHADLACSLLGKPKCAQRIRALAKLEEPTLREAACQYLKAYMGEACTP